MLGIIFNDLARAQRFQNVGEDDFLVRHFFLSMLSDAQGFAGGLISDAL